MQTEGVHFLYVPLHVAYQHWSDDDISACVTGLQQLFLILEEVSGEARKRDNRTLATWLEDVCCLCEDDFTLVSSPHLPTSTITSSTPTAASAFFDDLYPFSSCAIFFHSVATLWQTLAGQQKQVRSAALHVSNCHNMARTTLQLGRDKSQLL